MRTTGVIIGTIAALLALYAGALALRWVAAPWSGRVSAREQIQSGTHRIQAYNHFFDLCAAVQSTEATMDAQWATNSADAHLGQNIAALQAQRAEDINQYNADAQKSYTEGQFRASGLPFQLSASLYTGRNRTVCAR